MSIEGVSLLRQISSAADTTVVVLVCLVVFLIYKSFAQWAFSQETLKRIGKSGLVILSVPLVVGAVVAFILGRVFIA